MFLLYKILIKLTIPTYNTFLILYKIKTLFIKFWCLFACLYAFYIFTPSLEPKLHKTFCIIKNNKILNNFDGCRWSRRNRHGMQGTHRRDVVDYRTGYIRSHLRSPSGRVRWPNPTPINTDMKEYLLTSL